MPKKRKFHPIFILILIIYIGYAGFYIYRTSFSVDGQRYFVLFDDAMISMRYARNLARGFGPVWNPGETPVEGYTNPLWVLFMAFFHLFPISPSKISLLIQISGAVFLLANLYFVKMLAETLSPNPVVSYLAVGLTAFYVPLNNWGLQGMEVSFLVLVVTASAWMVLQNLADSRFSFWPYILLGFGTFVRIDMAVPYLAVLGFLILFDSKNRQSHLIFGISTLAIFIGSQTLVRYTYYGEMLPNTYYLKMAGFPLLTRIKRGAYVLLDLIRQMNWVLVLLPLTLLYFRRDRSVFLLFVLIIGQVAYSIYVGGDAWEHKGGSNRYISLTIPLFFCLFMLALDGWIDKIKSQKESSSNNITYWIANLGLLVFVFASLLNFNFLVNIRSLERMFLVRQPDFIEANKEYVRIANALMKFTTPEARIAVVTAGAIPYFTDLPAIDLLGKNDPVIARQENHIPVNIGDIRPGHMKWDYPYAIGELQPDVVVQLWGGSRDAETILAQAYTVVEADGMLFSVRTGSPRIYWDRVTIQP
jgi:hypothetical protein